jgi:hypothetical protein
MPLNLRLSVINAAGVNRPSQLANFYPLSGICVPAEHLLSPVSAPPRHPIPNLNDLAHH